MDYEEYAKKERAKRLQNAGPLSFTNETIIITDPCYILKGDGDDHVKCDYGHDMGALGFKKWLSHDTIYGDWSCTVYEQGTDKELGEFCADGGMVAVFSLAEVLKYNPAFDLHVERPWTTTTIEDFTGDVSIQVKKIRDSGCDLCDYEVSVIGKGNINFYSKQTGA